MGHPGSAARRRARTSAYASGIAAVAALALASPTAAQSTGGTAPQLSAPPPGVTMRQAPRLRTWRCVQGCADARAPAGALLRLRGLRLGRTYEVTFRGGQGDADDVATAPVRRERRVVDVRVPLGATGGPLVVTDRDGLQSRPSAEALAITPPAALEAAGGTPTVQVQAAARRAFFDASRPASASFVVHAGAPTHVTVDVVRMRDSAVVRSWDRGDVLPETPEKLTWNGTAGGRLQAGGRYSFQVTAVITSGVRAVTARSPAAEPDPAEFRLLGHEFPVRGPHTFGTGAAAFGGGRGHEGQDVFAACGTPIAAARGGVVEFKRYHSRAGHYLVIDGRRTGIDYAYMHLLEPALVDVGDRVRTGQTIGYVGQTGRATGCHLHFENWTAPGWYTGGQAFDPLPSLRAWDKLS
jgi:hypothetical protein